jgi:hypothetical protein
MTSPRLPSLPAAHDTSCQAQADASPRAETDASRATTAEPDASCSPANATADPSCGPAALRVCAWCRGPIPERARRDAVCCSTRCRQARHRFTTTVGRGDARGVAAGRPLRLAYADPPYPGKAWLYRAHPDYAGEVDHAALVRRLSTYDGWALSTSAAALPAVLALCPPGVRVAAWHRGERATPSRWPLSAWEPVIYHGGRQQPPSGGLAGRRVDSLVHGVSPLTTLPGRVIGAKPAAFCRWVFDLLGAAPGDTLDDLFPGSGAVSRAWAAFTGPSCQVLPGASRSSARDATRRLDPPDASCPPTGATPARQGVAA